MSYGSNTLLTIRKANIFQDINTVLNDVNFEMEKGEFVYLIGRTGSGKSSLLKTLYADLPLLMGDIQIVGYDLSKIKRKDIPFLRRKLGIIFQDFQLFPDRSVAENLYFVMRATGWRDKGKMKNRMIEVLMRVGLGSVATKMPHQLSGGEQQRVVIARALINEPLLMIADEPTGNLDPEVSDGIMKLFKDINRAGTAIIMATHNHTILRDFPGRILKCENARLLDSSVDEFSL
ncbi:cell division ATP-binding protein FtsE [Peijinzhouia sedimentorum]